MMNRRKALKMAAGALAVGGAGVVTLTTAFKNEDITEAPAKKIDLDTKENDWKYTPLDPDETAALAYKNYKDGSCMYGVFSSIVMQLGQKIGEPYASFPIHMMKYGHGGIGGTGTICGTLNGAAAVFGLLMNNKKISDPLTTELFSWYEKTPMPHFIPQKPYLDYTPILSESKSTLCHASTTRWCKKSGHRIDSSERKERCKRLTADVAAHTVKILNMYHANTFVTSDMTDSTANTCMSCHGSKGKLGNTSGQMECETCHDKSIGHKLFGDVHYKFMDKK